MLLLLALFITSAQACTQYQSYSDSTCDYVSPQYESNTTSQGKAFNQSHLTTPDALDCLTQCNRTYAKLLLADEYAETTCHCYIVDECTLKGGPMLGTLLICTDDTVPVPEPQPTDTSLPVILPQQTIYTPLPVMSPQQTSPEPEPG